VDVLSDIIVGTQVITIQFRRLNMKNIFVLILGFLTVSMLFVGTNVWADAQDLTGSGTIADSGAGPGLAVQLSPKVTVSYNGISTTFELCGLNTSGSVEYGVSSGTQGVYMHAATLDENRDPVLTTLPTNNGDTVTSWTLMGSTSGS
jgi:hypothetical protein